MAEAIIFVGLQGSGKTTYFRDRFAHTHAHVSRDIQETAVKERALLDSCLDEGRSFVVDNTNVTRAARDPYIGAARHAGFRVICYFFDTPIRTAIGRNNHRTDKKAVPVPAILRDSKRLQPPSLDEGFDQIHTITPSEDTNRSPIK